MSAEADAWYGLVVVEPLADYARVVPDGAKQAYVYVAAAAADEAELRRRIEESAGRRALAVVEFDTVENGPGRTFRDAGIEEAWRDGVASGDVLWDTTYRWF